MKIKSRPIIQPAARRRLVYTAFENTDTLLHQAINVLRELHDETDESVRVKLPDVPPEPSEDGLKRLKLDKLMKNVDAFIANGTIDSARNLYHYFVDGFRHEMQPNLNLPPLSIHQPRLDLPKQDLLVTLINSAKVAEAYHDRGLNKGWDNLDLSVQNELSVAAVDADASLELTKLGFIRLNQLANLITNTGAWQDGRESQRHLWTQAEVDEVVAIVEKREDRVSLLMRFEYFINRCFPSITMPEWERPQKVTQMTQEEILAELYADFRNDYIIANGMRGILSIAHQPKITVEEAVAQHQRMWRPYGLKLQKIINTHVNPSAEPDEKLQQLRVAVATQYQYALQEYDEDQFEVIAQLARILQYRSDLTWEDIERKAVLEKSVT